MAEISDILTTLLERTRQNKVSWQTTADESAFVAVLGKASVIIEENTSSYVTLIGEHVEPGVILRVLDSEGRNLEQLHVGYREGGEWAEQLRELYSEAKRIALGVDSQLDDLLKELQAGD